eukprot:6489128-Amphidinium_carterae.1
MVHTFEMISGDSKTVDAFVIVGQAVGQGGGMDHCGYLVLRKGEVAKILYVGSEKTADADWLFAEVEPSRPWTPKLFEKLRARKPGRRGWCPAGVPRAVTARAR